MNEEQLDEAIIARFPGRAWEDAVPMPSSSWLDGGPLLEEEDIEFDICYAPGGWDSIGGKWLAFWRAPNRERASGIGPTMLVAGMRAILSKPAGPDPLGGKA